jgi:mono/diheme cytochrome c family protein
MLTAAALVACPARSCTGGAAVDLSSLVASGASPERGRELFLKYCALCHGARADGRGVRSGFERPPADFTSPRWQRPEEAARVMQAIRDGVPDSSMPSWNMLGDKAVADLAAYVLSVARVSSASRPP